MGEEEDRMGNNILSIDVGLSGGVAVVDAWGRLLARYPMPSQTKFISRSRRRMYDTHAFTKLIKSLRDEYKIVCAAVERVGASPAMGVSSAFSFGHGYGIIHGVLEACGIKCVAIEPTIWKRKIGVSGSDKRKSVDKAKELWPEWSWKYSEEGMAEASLIGRYLMLEVDVWS